MSQTCKICFSDFKGEIRRDIESTLERPGAAYAPPSLSSRYGISGSLPGACMCAPTHWLLPLCERPRTHKNATCFLWQGMEKVNRLQLYHAGGGPGAAYAPPSPPGSLRLHSSLLGAAYALLSSSCYPEVNANLISKGMREGAVGRSPGQPMRPQASPAFCDRIVACSELPMRS